MNTKKQLLDPIGSVCKLITLNFTGLNTKLSIHDHILIIDKPFALQYVSRRIFGDGIDNIGCLYTIITQFIEWYLVHKNIPAENTYHEYFDDQLCPFANRENIRNKTFYII